MWRNQQYAFTSPLCFQQELEACDFGALLACTERAPPAPYELEKRLRGRIEIAAPERILLGCGQFRKAQPDVGPRDVTAPAHQQPHQPRNDPGHRPIKSERQVCNHGTNADAEPRRQVS